MTTLSNEQKALQDGLIIRVDVGVCTVLSLGKEFRCKISGLMRGQESQLTNLIAVGDNVRFSPLPDSEGYIEEVLPRSSALVRPSMKHNKSIQVIAANLDLLVIVASVDDPRFDLRFVDRLMIAAQIGEIRPLICVSKCDLAKNRKFEKKLKPYQDMQIPVVLTSIHLSQGLDTLSEHLKNKISLLAGKSGVGKTSIMNALVPGSDFKTREVSAYTGKGKHTTTFSQLIKLPSGGFLVDTPGLKGFRVGVIETSELAYYFKEMEPFLGNCKFSDCAHRSEPKCAVIKAVEDGLIPKARYESYLRIYESLLDNER